MRTSFLAPLLGFWIMLFAAAGFSDAARAAEEKIPAETSGGSGQQEPQKSKNRVPGPMISPQAWPGGTGMPSGKFSIVDHVSYSQGKLYKGSSRYTNRNASGQKTGPKSNEIFTNVLKFRYGIAWDRLDIRTSTPFVNNEIKRHGQGGIWKGGIGDTTVVLRYQIKQRTDTSPFCFAVDAGVILPTGHTGDKNKYTATNAFAVLAGGGASWIDANQRVDVDAGYVAYTNEGKHDIKPGSYARFHGHYAYAFPNNFDLGAETSLRIEQASEVNGRSQRDSYTEWYAGPKIQFRVPEWYNFSIGAAVLFPLYRHYESTKMSTNAKFEFRTGITF